MRTRAVAPPVVTVTVDGERIREIQPSSPWDLVRRLTGIEIHEQGQGPGYASDAVLRGFTSDHSSDVLFVVDGVPFNLPVHGHVEGYADCSAGTGTVTVGYGHDADADELTFGPIDVTVQ